MIFLRPWTRARQKRHLYLRWKDSKCRVRFDFCDDWYEQRGHRTVMRPPGEDPAADDDDGGCGGGGAGAKKVAVSTGTAAACTLVLLASVAATPFFLPLTTWLLLLLLTFSSRSARGCFSLTCSRYLQTPRKVREQGLQYRSWWTAAWWSARAAWSRNTLGHHSHFL